MENVTYVVAKEDLRQKYAICTCQIEAKSTVGNLDDLSTLYVLPPKEVMSYD